MGSFFVESMCRDEMFSDGRVMIFTSYFVPTKGINDQHVSTCASTYLVLRSCALVKQSPKVVNLRCDGKAAL